MQDRQFEERQPGNDPTPARGRGELPVRTTKLLSTAGLLLLSLTVAAVALVVMTLVGGRYEPNHFNPLRAPTAALAIVFVVAVSLLWVLFGSWRTEGTDGTEAAEAGPDDGEPVRPLGTTPGVVVAQRRQEDIVVVRLDEERWARRRKGPEPTARL